MPLNVPGGDSNRSAVVNSKGGGFVIFSGLNYNYEPKYFLKYEEKKH